MREIFINRAFAEFCLESLKQLFPKYLTEVAASQTRKKISVTLGFL